MQLLALDEDEGAGSQGRYGDRWLLGMVQYAEPAPPRTRERERIAARVLSVDPCDPEDVQVVAEGMERAFAPAQDGLPWLGCNHDSGTVFTIDPDGVDAPVAVAHSPDCNVRQRGGATYLTVREGEGPSQIVRQDRTGFVTVVADLTGVTWSDDDATLYYTDSAGTHWEHDVASGAETRIVSGVAVALQSPSGRFVLSTAADDLSEPVPWRLLDRDTGAQRDDLVGELRHFADSALALKQVEETILMVELPSFEERSFPGEWNVVGVGPDGVAGMVSPSGDTLAKLDPDASDPTVLLRGFVVDAVLDGDAMLVWNYEGDPNDGRDISSRRSALLRVPLDGSPPEVLVDEVHQPLGLSDGRWITVRDPDAQLLGELWLVDPATGEEGLIDRDVTLLFARGNGQVHFFPEDALDPADPFFYRIHEAGERSGLWMARAAPR